MRIQVKVRLQYVLKNPECKPPFSTRNQMFAPLKQVNERISTVVAPPPPFSTNPFNYTELQDSGYKNKYQNQHKCNS